MTMVPNTAGPGAGDPPDAAGPGRAITPVSGTPPAAILTAARRLFAAHGFAGTSTRRIAEAAGVNLAMIHYYFGSKEQLYRRVVEQEFEQLFDSIRAAAGQQAAPADFLTGLPAQVMALHGRHPELRQLLMREMVDGAPRLPAMISEMGDRGPLGLRRFLSRFVEQAEGDGLSAGIPAAHLLAIIFAVGHGLMAFAPLLAEVFGLDPRDPGTAAEIGRSAGALVHRALAGGKEDRR